MNKNTGIKCLIVDDIEQNLVALEALLQHKDIMFLKARSAREALELLLENSDVALALLDVQMPEMNGFELAELIRGSERTRHIPLIFMTAGSQEQNWQFKGYESGAVDFLYKPIDPYILTTKVNIFVELYKHKKELSRELEARTEALRVNEMFMAVLSHDLRTPLQIIKMTAALLKRQKDLEKNQELADRVIVSGQQMSRMVSDLLDVTRIRQAGGLKLSTKIANLHELSESTVKSFQDCHPERTITYHIEGDPLGSWDVSLLAQVLNNILGNALQHGNREYPIEVFLDGSNQETLIIRIKNRGEIPEHMLSVLFNPFRGGERREGQVEGLGLGLYISQQIVIAHGGNIFVKSEENITEFEISLPREIEGEIRSAYL